MGAAASTQELQSRTQAKAAGLRPSAPTLRPQLSISVPEWEDGTVCQALTPRTRRRAGHLAQQALPGHLRAASWLLLHSPWLAASGTAPGRDVARASPPPGRSPVSVTPNNRRKSMAERFRRTALGRVMNRLTPTSEPASPSQPDRAGANMLLAYLNTVRRSCGLAPVELSQDSVSAVPAPDSGPAADPLPLIGSDSGSESDKADQPSVGAGTAQPSTPTTGAEALPEPTLTLDAPTPLSGLDCLLRRLDTRAALLHPDLRTVAFRFQRYHPMAPSVAHAGTLSQGRLTIRVEIVGFSKRRGTPGRGRRLSLTGRLLSRRRRDSNASPTPDRSRSPAGAMSPVLQGRARDSSPRRRRSSFVSSPVPRMLQALSGAASPQPSREQSPPMHQALPPGRESPAGKPRRSSFMRPRGLSIPDLLNLDRGSPTPMGATSSSPVSPTSNPTTPADGPALAAIMYPPRDCVDVLLPRAADGPFKATVTLFASNYGRRRGGQGSFVAWREPVSVLSSSVERAPLPADEGAPKHFAQLDCDPLVTDAPLPAPPGWEQPPVPPCVELELQGSALRPGDTIRVSLVLALEGHDSEAASPAPPATQTVEWTFAFRPPLHWHVGSPPVGASPLPRPTPLDIAFAQARPDDVLLLQCPGTRAPPRLEVGASWDDRTVAGAGTLERVAWREVALAALSVPPRSSSLRGHSEERTVLLEAEADLLCRGEVCMPLAAVSLPAGALEDGAAHLAVSARLLGAARSGVGGVGARYFRLAIEAYTRHWRQDGGEFPSVLDYNDRVAAPGAPAIADEAFLILPLSRVKGCLQLAPGGEHSRVLYLRPAVIVSRDGVVSCDEAPPGLAVELRVTLLTLAAPEPGPIARIRSGFRVEGEEKGPRSKGDKEVEEEWAVVAAAEGQWSTSRVMWPCFRIHIAPPAGERCGAGAAAPTQSRRLRVLLEASGRDMRLGLRVPPMRLFDHRRADSTFQTCLAWSSRAGPTGLLMVADLLPRHEPYWAMPAFPDWFDGEEGSLVLRVCTPPNSHTTVHLTQHSMSAHDVG